MGPVAGGSSEDAAGAEAASEALVGKLITIVVDMGNADAGSLQKTKGRERGIPDDGSGGTEVGSPVTDRGTCWHGY